MANGKFRDVYNRGLEGQKNETQRQGWDNFFDTALNVMPRYSNKRTALDIHNKVGETLYPPQAKGSFGAPGAGGEEIMKLLQLLSGPIYRSSNIHRSRFLNSFHPPGSPYKAAKILDALALDATQSGKARYAEPGAQESSAHENIDSLIIENTLLDYLTKNTIEDNSYHPQPTTDIAFPRDYLATEDYKARYAEPGVAERDVRDIIADIVSFKSDTTGESPDMKSWLQRFYEPEMQRGYDIGNILNK